MGTIPEESKETRFVEVAQTSQLGLGQAEIRRPFRPTLRAVRLQPEGGGEGLGL